MVLTGRESNVKEFDARSMVKVAVLETGKLGLVEVAVTL
jgi:hypothetical protein